MPAAAKPANESERLEALNDLDILETPIEERFDRITRIVCRALGVPIAAVSLVDDDRQWFKSIQGLEAAETPRDMAFCAHTILGDEPLVVPNAPEDERFADNPLVTGDPSIRYYAGCPLILDDNIRVGTLCAIDRKPHEITDEELAVLRDLADIVQGELMRDRLAKANNQLAADLAVAERATLIDPLSRLWSQAGGQQMLEREWELALRNETPVGVMMLDIDQCDLINDEYGREVGDAVIRHIGRTVSTVLRPYDVVARWVDDAFLIITPRCSAAGLEIAAERMLNGIRGNLPELPTGEIAVTASIGARAADPMKGDELAATLKGVEAALVAAHTSGGDRWVVGDPADAPAARVANG